jgi:hypothetical protein
MLGMGSQGKGQFRRCYESGKNNRRGDGLIQNISLRCGIQSNARSDRQSISELTAT